MRDSTAAMAQPTRLHLRFTFYNSVDETFFYISSSKRPQTDAYRVCIEAYNIFFVSTFFLRWLLLLLLLGPTNFEILSMINRLKCVLWLVIWFIRCCHSTHTLDIRQANQWNFVYLKWYYPNKPWNKHGKSMVACTRLHSVYLHILTWLDGTDAVFDQCKVAKISFFLFNEWNSNELDSVD